MLYVVFHQGLALGWDTVKWEVGDLNPLDVERKKYKKADYHEQMAMEAEGRWLGMVAYIQADGDELSYITNQYIQKNSNNIDATCPIPFPANKDVVRWYGDIARTILMNL